VQDLESTDRALKFEKRPDAYIHKDESLKIVEDRLDKNHFATYRHRVKESWLFRLAPGFLTTLLLPIFIYFTNDKRRIWWLGCAAMWYFTLILLSTIGRPLDRYLLPVVPIMFWTLSSAVIFAATWWLARLPGIRSKNSVLSAQSL
jgi:energy-coupling factor transporter transmembrane protein EcfT